MFGLAMCVGVGVGKFSPKAEVVAGVGTPTVVVEAGTNLLAPEVLIWTQRVSFRVEESVEIDSRWIYNSQGRALHLLDMTSPAPTVSEE